MKLKDRLINYGRIAPLALSSVVVAAGLSVDKYFNWGLYENLPQTLQNGEDFLIYYLSITGLVYCAGGIDKYRKFKEDLKHWERFDCIDDCKPLIQQRLENRADCNVLKAAAHSCGLDGKIKEIEEELLKKKVMAI